MSSCMQKYSRVTQLCRNCELWVCHAARGGSKVEKFDRVKQSVQVAGYIVTAFISSVNNITCNFYGYFFL